ncbi:MAG: hypothetical protein AAGF99_02550 [Bacteroidota bacterium]
MLVHPPRQRLAVGPVLRDRLHQAGQLLSLAVLLLVGASATSATPHLPTDPHQPHSALESPDPSVAGDLAAWLVGTGGLPSLPDSVARAYPADTTETLRQPGQPLTVFGYYRLIGYYRDFSRPYPGLEPFERAWGTTDGYREPMLSVNVLGRPNGRSSFGTELFIFAPYDGSGTEENVLSLNLGINFYGNFRTGIGSFGVRAGGIHWYNLSPFTIGVFQVLDRFSIFDRTPWEGVSGLTRYDNYFQSGQLATGDARWNFQAFQGLILNGGQLPGDFSFDAFWGKTQPNGGLPNARTEPSETVANEGEAGDVPTYSGFGGEAEALPSAITGGRLAKNFGSTLSLAYNGLYSYRTLDSLDTNRRSYQVHTGQLEANLFGVNVSGEFGASRFDSPTYTSPWGEALMARVRIPASATYFPLDVQVYQIGRHFYNENGEIATGNNPEIQEAINVQEGFGEGDVILAGAGGIGGTLTQVNQLAHNRRGINFNTKWADKSGLVEFGVGWGVAHELAATTSTLSFTHRINGLALSRVYNPFPADAVFATQFGPYGRKYSFFRGFFEEVPTTDVDQVTGVPITRKWYHSVDLTAKGRVDLDGRKLYGFYLGSFSSANRDFTALPHDDDTYLFYQSHEIDAYFELFPRVLLAGYLGVEFAKGGRFTPRNITLPEGVEVDPADPNAPRPSNMTMDQRGFGAGLGFDITLADNAGLYIRHRWLDFEDRAFAFDRYVGRELTAEIKVFF